MGTDINFYTERRNADGTWSYVPPPRKATEWEQMHHPVLDWDLDRSYSLFAILANVRNGYGFAGVVTGEGFNPISMPRGLPADLSPELRADFDTYLEHTPSWLLVSEILGFDWSQTSIHYGVVTPAVYVKWKAKGGGQPEGWSGGVFGQGVSVVTNERLDALLLKQPEIATQTDHRPRDGQSYYTQVAWKKSYLESTRGFHEDILPKLQELGPPDQGRCVFYFDS